MKRLLIVALAICSFFSLGGACEAPTASPPADSTTGEAEIIIRYSATTASQIGSWSVAKPGHVYLIVSLDIENRGYESFSTNSFCFYAIVDQVRYSTAWVSTDDELPLVDLLDGGKVSGNIVFEVPKQNGSVTYSLTYDAIFPTYNIGWVRQ